MSRTQSVAEHSFNVAMIVGYLGPIWGCNSQSVLEMVADSLYHDEDEVYTGDMPSPSKEHTGECNLIKLADLIESYRFAAQYCNDTIDVKSWLLKGLIMNINNMAVAIGISYELYRPLLEEVRI